MKLSEFEFLKLAAVWATAADPSTMRPGTTREKTLNRPAEFLAALRQGQIAPPASPLDDATIEFLHTACSLLTDAEDENLRPALASAEAIYGFIEMATWPEPDFDERAELLCACAFAGWRISRRLGKPGEEAEWLKMFHAAATLPSPLRLQLEQVLATPIVKRMEIASQLHLDDPETLLSLLVELPTQWDTAPAKVLEEATFIYGYLENLEVRFPTDPILYGEREYFLGESARIAGAASRFLARRSEAREWFDLAEGWFLATENAISNIARLAYQRLALRTEERDFDAVLSLLPHLTENFERLAMPEDALKARFLRATVLKEIGRIEESISAFLGIVEEAKRVRSTLLTGAYVSLVQGYGSLGDSASAMAFAKEATPLLQQANDRLLIGKLQDGLGRLLRNTGHVAESIDAFREAQRQFSEIEMRADVAAIHLVLADLLLDAGQPAQAELEIRAALPIIEEYMLVPERIAAFSLLRDSLRRRQIDRQALRELHSYFPKRQG